MKEPFLEPILRKMRLKKVLPIIKRYKNCSILDIGCGWEAKLLKIAEPYISTGVGIDIKAPKKIDDNKKLKILATSIEKELPFPDRTFDLVTMLAVLEHLEHPIEIMCEINRILKDEGLLILTVPSVWSQPVLEFLAFKIGIVNPEEISDHKLYYNKLLLDFIGKKSGFIMEKHQYFQFWMNNFCIFKKCLNQ